MYRKHDFQDLIRTENRNGNRSSDCNDLGNDDDDTRTIVVFPACTNIPTD